MNIARIALPVFGLAILGLGMANTVDKAKPSASGSSLRLDSKTEAALDTLHQEIQRRFHDRNEVDFGFSRLIRNGSRLHMFPPLMERQRIGMAPDTPGTPTTRMVQGPTPGSPGRFEVNDPELGWTDTKNLRGAMHAENEREDQAIKALRASNVDVAIYTFGLLGVEGTEPRAKGPGYVSQKGLTGPPAEALASFAKQAWRAGANDVVIEGPKGWYLMAHRVKADARDCVTCHAHTRQAVIRDRALPAGERLLYKVGEDLGMVIIAVHPRTPR